MNIVHHFGGGVYAKETHFKAGEIACQHKHKHEHLSILAKGWAKVFVDGVETGEIRGPACLTIKAGTVHRVKALSDIVWFCIHATDVTDPDEVDEALVED